MELGNNSEAIRIDELRCAIQEIQETVNKLHEKNEVPGHIIHTYKLELELLSNKLSREIKDEFFESIKRWLWVFTLIIAFATAGGYFQLSGFIKSQIDEKIKEKESDIASIRRDIMKELVDFERKSQEAIAKIDILENQITNRSQNAILTIKKSLNNVAYFESITVKKRNTGGFNVRQKTSLNVRNPIFGSLPPDFIAISASPFGTSGQATTKGSLFSVALA